MEFTDLLAIVDDLPVFETGILLTGDVDRADVARQLSRWTASGQLYQLRRGVYALAPPFRKVKAHPFVVANTLVRGSYVSLQSALAHYGMIPEFVPLTTSITTGRPARWDTPLGSFDYRHVKAGWFHGYALLDLGARQSAFVATPEKALLDLIYLESGADKPAYLETLRLQALDQLDLDHLARLADASKSAKLQRAASILAELARVEATEYESL